MVDPLTFLVSRLIIGGAGSGKSEGVISEVVDLAEAGECAIVLMDAHGLTARKLMLHLIDQGLLHRVLYDLFSSFDRVLAGISIGRSDDNNSFRRKSRNIARVISLMNILWRATQRDEEKVFSMPMLSKYLKWGIKLLMFQPQNEPLSKLLYAYQPKHPEFKRLVTSCTDRMVKMEGQYIATLDKSNNFSLLESKIGGAQRATEASLEFDAFRERADGSFNLGEALLQRKIIILDASDDGSVPKELATAIFGCWNFQIFTFLQQHFATTKQPCPVVLVWEEAPATNIISPYEINMLREGRKMGLSAWVIGQDLGFLDPKTKSAVKSCTVEHCWYNPGDTDLAKEAADDIAIRQLDPYMVHHVDETERVLADGFDYEQRQTVAESDHEGKKGKTISHTHVPIARHRTVKDIKKSFTALNDQVMLTATVLLEQGPGWRMITNRNTGYVSEKSEYIDMLPDPFPEDDFPGLAEDMLTEGIKTSQAEPEFKTPVDSEEIWEETTTASAKSGQTKPSKNLPKPHTRPDNSTRK